MLCLLMYCLGCELMRATNEKIRNVTKHLKHVSYPVILSIFCAEKRQKHPPPVLSNHNPYSFFPDRWHLKRIISPGAQDKPNLAVNIPHKVAKPNTVRIIAVSRTATFFLCDQPSLNFPEKSSSLATTAVQQAVTTGSLISACKPS